MNTNNTLDSFPQGLGPDTSSTNKANNNTNVPPYMLARFIREHEQVVIHIASLQQLGIGVMQYDSW